MLQHAGTKKCTCGPILKDVIYQYSENPVTANFCSSYQKILVSVQNMYHIIGRTTFFKQKYQWVALGRSLKEEAPQLSSISTISLMKVKIYRSWRLWLAWWQQRQWCRRRWWWRWWWWNVDAALMQARVTVQLLHPPTRALSSWFFHHISLSPHPKWIRTMVPGKIPVIGFNRCHQGLLSCYQRLDRAQLNSQWCTGIFKETPLFHFKVIAS